MKRYIKILAFLLLLINASGAIYGGLSMIIYPDGSHIHLSPDLLKYSFFEDYFTPGLILLVTNGLLSLYALVAIIISQKKYWRPVMWQGAILIGWLIIQLALIHIIHYFQLIMFMVGIILILAGNELYKIRLKTSPGEAL